MAYSRTGEHEHELLKIPVSAVDLKMTPFRTKNILSLA